MEALLLISLIGFGYALFTIYNRLRGLAETVKRARADVVATMKKRLDIAGRLSAIAANYGEHEKLAHFPVSEVAADMNAARNADGNIGHVVSQVQTIATRYPELKANQTYQQLMAQLEGLEETILKRRETYNEAVRDYNACRSALPQVLFASRIGFDEAAYFNVDENGLDHLAEFKTDDGRLLTESLGRIASRLAPPRIAPVELSPIAVNQIKPPAIKGT